MNIRHSLRGVACGLLLVSSTALAAPKPKSCWDAAQTQDELNRCASADATAAQQQLTRVYQQIQQKYADDPAFVAKLKAAQAAWTTFRDAEMQAIFPPAHDAKRGSVLPMCVSIWQTRLTEQRTRQLRRWLDGVVEGDTCGGSIKTKAELKAPTKKAATPSRRKRRRR